MKLMSIAMKPLCSPPFPLDYLEEMTALMGGDALSFHPILPFPLFHDLQTVPPDMAKQEQHPHASGFRFGQRCAKLRLNINIRPYLGDAFHLNYKGHCAPISCPLRLR